MNKLIPTLLAAVLATTTSAVFADDDKRHTQHVTVKQALQLADDRNIRLTGKIVKHLGDDHYQFRDATGSITLDLDDDSGFEHGLIGKTVTIFGEVDRDDDSKRVEIEVDLIQKS